MREPEEAERFRFVFAPLASFFGSKPAELYQAGLIGVQAERKTSQPFPTSNSQAKGFTLKSYPLWAYIY